MIFWRSLYAVVGIIQKFFYLFLDASGILLGLHVTSIMARILAEWTIHPYEALVALVLWGGGALVIHVTHYTLHFTGLNVSLVKWLEAKLFGQTYFVTR